VRCPFHFAVIPAKAGIQSFEIPGFRVALATASSPGMTILCNELLGQFDAPLRQHTGLTEPQSRC
jgi:hypothetical protein